MGDEGRNHSPDVHVLYTGRWYDVGMEGFSPTLIICALGATGVLFAAIVLLSRPHDADEPRRPVRRSRR